MKRAPAVLLLVSSMLSILACSGPLPTPVANTPPVVRLTHAPLEDGSAYFYAYRMNWIGYDADGRIEYFEYAIDPPTHVADIDWRQTTRNEQILLFDAPNADESDLRNPATAFHTFAIRATDDDGAVSDVASRSFFSFTVAPTVNIVNPPPSKLRVANVSPAVRITWTGTDPDGQFTTRPVQYKYLLITPSSEFPQGVALADPDSIRRFYAPKFAGWDSTTADSAWVQYTNLVPGSEYLFVVVAIDEAGAYSPIFSLDSNVLRMRVGFAANLGPRITIFNDFFYYQYPSGGYSTDPSREIPIEAVAGERVKFNWFATPSPGSSIVGYRWALDIEDVSDETPRSSDDDVTHWSDLSLLTTTATVGPFAEASVYRFYVEARDNNGLRSLGIVRMTVVSVTGGKPLLIVDDTRFLGDQVLPGRTCPEPPTGEWPSAAELDTFLYARGGVPWRCCEGLTQRGLFAGYPFDTLGTRNGDNDASVRLAQLALYDHVVWLIDGRSATNTRPGSDPFNPMTSLRYMSQAGRFNALAAYARQGGKVWLVGGGGAAATLYPWNSSANDGGGVTWSNSLGELIPGRFIYDFACWRSEIKVIRASGFIERHLGRNETRMTWPGQPDYTRLPILMRGKSPGRDQFPPCRSGQSPTVFYKSTFDVEFLSLSDFCIEDLDPDPDRLDEQSVLDSVYKLTTFALPPTTQTRVCMTYYHGRLGPPFVFTGFSIWDFTRADCQSLVDFVLQDIWGLGRLAFPLAAQPPSAAPGNLRPTRRSGAAGGARRRVDRL